jgi:hypothetical protein
MMSLCSECSQVSCRSVFVLLLLLSADAPLLYIADPADLDSLRRRDPCGRGDCCVRWVGNLRSNRVEGSQWQTAHAGALCRVGDMTV